MILPGQKSESTKKIDEIRSDLGGFTIFVKDPDQPRSFSDVFDTRYRVVILYRVKHRVPAPRVWSKWEELLYAPPFYSYNVWVDNPELPVHYWAGPVELITLKEHYNDST